MDKRFLSIRTKFIIFIFLVFGTIMLTMSLFVGNALKNTTMETMEETMTETVKLGARSVANQIDTIDAVLTEIASADELIGDNATVETQTAFIDKKREEYRDRLNGDIFYSDKDGTVLGLGLDIRERDFYQKGIAGERYFSDPMIRKDTGTLGYTYVVPVVKNGQTNGILYLIIDSQAMLETIANTKIGDLGDAYVVNANGDTMIYSDEQMVIDKYNTTEESKSDPSLKKLAEIEQRASSGETGFSLYTYAGNESFAIYAPIDGLDGLGIIITANKDEFMAGTTRTVLLVLGVLLILSILGALAMMKIASRIAGPLKEMSDRMALLAEGDLDTPVEHINMSDEVGLLNDSLIKTTDSLRSYIDNIKFITAEMARNNLNVSFNMEYKGSFSAIKSALENIQMSFGQSLGKISQSVEPVAAGSGQLSRAAQSLSQGSAEQATAVQDLVSNITEITEKIRENAVFSTEISENAKKMADEIKVSDQYMSEMTAAMDSINKASEGIEKIVKVIEDISFQTNILALNAAVEAARAGTAGKGFAVVADEVRNLAAKSQEATKDTSLLITDSLQAVEKGMKIAADTASSLGEVVEEANRVTQKVSLISSFIEEQSGAMEQISSGLDTISSVVQTNSSLAQESAISSEELSEQAKSLQGLTGAFILPEQTP